VLLAVFRVIHLQTLCVTQAISNLSTPRPQEVTPHPVCNIDVKTFFIHGKFTKTFLRLFIFYAFYFKKGWKNGINIIKQQIKRSFSFSTV